MRAPNARWGWDGNEEDCLLTVRCTSTEPASTSNPITTHTPSRPQGPTPPNEPHPARLAACRQMETPGGAVPAPLGMTNQSYPSKGRERTRMPSRHPSIALAIAPHCQARDARSRCAGCVLPGLC